MRFEPELPFVDGKSEPTWHKAAALARKWQLNKLAGRLEEMARKTSPPSARSIETELG